MIRYMQTLSTPFVSADFSICRVILGAFLSGKFLDPVLCDLEKL